MIPSKELRHIYLEAMALLIRNNLIVQLHMYMFLYVPKDIAEKAVVYHPQGSGKNFMIANPGSPTDFEKGCIDLLIDSRHSPIVRALFTRCLLG